MKAMRKTFLIITALCTVLSACQKGIPKDAQPMVSTPVADVETLTIRVRGSDIKEFTFKRGDPGVDFLFCGNNRLEYNQLILTGEGSKIGFRFYFKLKNEPSGGHVGADVYDFRPRIVIAESGMYRYDGTARYPDEAQIDYMSLRSATSYIRINFEAKFVNEITDETVNISLVYEQPYFISWWNP